MTQKPIETEKNIFILEEIFPDASGIFSGRFSKLDDSFEEAMIVFDTNVLLLPYSMGNESLGKLKELYQKLVGDNRLFIPSRVAREFAKNRNTKLTEIHHSVLVQKKGKTKNNLRYPILENLDEKKILDGAFEKLLMAEQEYYKAITNLASTIKAWGWNDPVSSMYSDLFVQDVLIDHDKTDEKLKEELQRRFKLQIPPGYKDASKGDGGIGDLSIWLSILSLGNKEKKDIIFVTEDIKPDWWNQSNGSEFLPRYELIDEFRRNSDGRTLHIIRLSKLLELFNVEVTLIGEAKKAEDFMGDIFRKIREKSRLRRVKTCDGMTQQEIKDQMHKWFYDNYEDPAFSLQPDDPFLYGCIFSARKVLFDEFDCVLDDSIIEGFAAALDEVCEVWAMKEEQ